jgi:hypothetical protein
MFDIPSTPIKQDLLGLITDTYKNAYRDKESITRMLDAGWITGSGITDVGRNIINQAVSRGICFSEEQIFDGRDFTYFNPVNTLQQDLFLLAKNHYGNEINRLRAAAIVVSQHQMISLEHIKADCVLHWLLKEFVEPGLILNNFFNLNRFLMDAGRFPNKYSSYHATLVRGLLDEISMLRVWGDNGESLMPFEIPKKRSTDGLRTEAVH